MADWTHLRKTKLSAHFDLFECCYSAKYPHLIIAPTPEIIIKASEFAENILEDLRQKVGRALKPSSWWRNYRLNKAVGGESHSVHQIFDLNNVFLGVATDILVPTGMSLWDLFKAAVETKCKCAIIYPKRNFIHVDSSIARPTREFYVSAVKGKYVPITLEQIRAH